MADVKILVCDPIHEDGVNLLLKAGYQVNLDTEITHGELLEKVKKYDALVVRSRTKVTADVLDKTEKLKAIARAGVGLDNIDLPKTREKGIQVFNSPEAPCNAVAELVIGMIFSMARNIASAVRLNCVSLVRTNGAGPELGVVRRASQTRPADPTGELW